MRFPNKSHDHLCGDMCDDMWFGMVQMVSLGVLVLIVCLCLCVAAVCFDIVWLYQIICVQTI